MLRGLRLGWGDRDSPLKLQLRNTQKGNHLFLPTTHLPEIYSIQDKDSLKFFQSCPGIPAFTEPIFPPLRRLTLSQTHPGMKTLPIPLRQLTTKNSEPTWRKDTCLRYAGKLSLHVLQSNISATHTCSPRQQALSITITTGTEAIWCGKECRIFKFIVLYVLQDSYKNYFRILSTTATLSCLFFFFFLQCYGLHTGCFAAFTPELHF